MNKLKLGILISGRGSNMQALIDAARQPGYPAEVALVISNVAGAPGLDKARDAGVPALTIPHRSFRDKAGFEDALTEALRSARVDLVCLAGFMRVLGTGFVEAWQDRLINIHPSLLPLYRGLDTHARALEAGDAETGCTVHFVIPELDAGPIVLQASVPILPGDTPESLTERLLPVEHRTYVEAVRRLAHDRLAN